MDLKIRLDLVNQEFLQRREGLKLEEIILTISMAVF